MKKLLIALILLAGCGGPDQPGNGTTGDDKGASPEASERAAPAGLAGLYEGGPPGQPNQLCIVEGSAADARFGIIVWGANMHSCSGAGEAARDGNRLRLRMAGDQACDIEAVTDGATVTLAGPIPQGCAYYCGARARFEGAAFTRKGGRPEDAMQAKDLVGDPLCEGGSN